MQEAGGDHTGAGADVAQQVGHCHRMADVGLAAGPHLAVVQLIGEVKGGSEQPFGVGGAAVAGAGGHVLDAAAQPVRQGNAVVVGAADGPRAAQSSRNAIQECRSS